MPKIDAVASPSLKLSRAIAIALCATACLCGAATATATPRYTFTDLGSLGGDDSYALGINGAGQVTGGGAIPRMTVTTPLFTATER